MNTTLSTTELKLQNFCKHSVNVLLIGKHGVGKTQMIKETFKNEGLKVGIFSASTLDAYVDLRGIPEIIENSDGTRSLHFVQTNELKTFDAIFLDELNRATPATLNALFELIQSRSINGISLPKLKMVWSAINPADEGSYQVEELDPALLDRFQVQMEIPNEISKSYFTRRYSESIATKVEAWWKSNNVQGIKNFPSPRRIDEAIAWKIEKGGSMRDFIPQRNIPIQFLEKALTQTSIINDLIKNISDAENDTVIEGIVNDPSNFITIKGNIDKLPTIIEKYLNLLNAENQATLQSLKTVNKAVKTPQVNISKSHKRYGLALFDLDVIQAFNLSLDMDKINNDYATNCITVERINKANKKTSPVFWDYGNAIMNIDKMKKLMRKRHNGFIEQALVNIYKILTDTAGGNTSNITEREIQVVNHLVYYLTVNQERPVPLNIIYHNTPDFIKSHVNFIIDNV